MEEPSRLISTVTAVSERVGLVGASSSCKVLGAGVAGEVVLAGLGASLDISRSI